MRVVVDEDRILRYLYVCMCELQWLMRNSGAGGGACGCVPWLLFFFFFSLFTASIFSFFIVTVAQSTGVGIGQRNEKYQKAKKVWGT